MKNTILALLLLSGASLAFSQPQTVKTVKTETVTTTNVIDTNNDQRITQEEFRNNLEIKAQLARWDINDDGMVTFDEFATGSFNAWDKDRNGEITLTEFNTDLPYWYVNAEKAQTFAIWDSNSDGEIHTNEFRDGIKKTGLSLSFYQDITKPLPVADFQTRVYSFWDTNRDGYISIQEYDNSRGRWVYVSKDGKS